MFWGLSPILCVYLQFLCVILILVFLSAFVFLSSPFGLSLFLVPVACTENTSIEYVFLTGYPRIQRRNKPMNETVPP